MIKPTATLATERLLLRQWQPSDLPVFAEMNADSEVMQYFPKVLSKQTSNLIANKCQQLIEDNGWGFWAVSLKEGAADTFIGMVGLNQIHADMPFTGVEIAWRLHKDYWRNGYALEAAQAALKYAFDVLALEEVVAFTAISNQPSQRLMQRLGMTNTNQVFDHPMLNTNHPLAPHVLHRISREDWQQLQIRD
ncbi:GNAT family N-acetyltransferase [uncultured Psychrobacter sp.]|uniref:GNAT family N-acetyltransferase n=1 Tax=uncultured Psychrobacter sp. TaxID=259303 RepID=UPI00262A6B17|nr:GNAT family N-acetyltransferase [uncultured Psychrobacter sp.]